MRTDTKYIIGFAAVFFVILAGIVTYFYRQENKPGQLDQFASCLAEKGAKFYGAFWCPHCQNQKKLFGNSAKKLPYVECSTPDGNGQTPICKEKKVESYPTWEFTMGTSTTRVTGEQSLGFLSQKTGCELPTGSAPTTGTSTATTSTGALVAPTTPVGSTTNPLR